MAKGLFSSLKGVDAFGKTTEDVKVKTRTGALLSILAAAIILSVTMIEFFDYRRINVDTSIIVEKQRRKANGQPEHYVSPSAMLPRQFGRDGHQW